MRALRGWLGELKASFNMWLFLDSNTYKRFHDIIIPSSNGTTQIDHVLVSKFGIFIIETKNKGGWIFGDENKPKWTQSFFGKNFSFQNPLRQTYRQKKVLSQFLSVDDSCIHTVIYFVGDCKFKTQLPSNVINSGLGRYIKSFTHEVLSVDDVNQIEAELSRYIAQSTLSTRDHIRSLQERHNSSTICPKCGGHLVLKTARKGPNVGSKFLGCESYPRCRFSKSA